jgi:indolepyruvate ferredoxin oxidoreductase, beta subunit
VTPGGRDGQRAASTADALVADKVTNILVAGVGGQGVIVAAAIIAEAALLQGDLEVKLSETHGMSQRGGSVQSQVRIGRHVVAPVISPGEVDYLLAFEAAEGLRLAPSLADEGVAIVNTQEIVPPLASMGEHSYPHDAIARMAARGLRVIAVDGNAVAEETGSAKVAGVVLLGALSTRLAFVAETWERAIVGNVGAEWLDLNLAAFAAGRKLGTTPDGSRTAADAPPASASDEAIAGGVDAGGVSP